MAARYYQFLEREGKGLEEIPILGLAKSSAGIALKIRPRVLSTENLLLRLGENEWRIGEDEVAALSLDEKHGILELACEEELARLWLEGKGLKLFSDLKFLVKNVERFYLEQTPRFPPAPRILPPPPPPRLSLEQQEAVAMLFSEPLSYVWGAPGTGKTRAVLFESLLHTLSQGTRAILVAPTNNALEQALFALLPQFDELGMERGNVLRLGTPSARFLESYPEVCDPLNVKKETMSLFDFEARKSPKARLEEALVIAMTVDNFIKRFETLPLAGQRHIFLDEAAFTPLIKALALLTLDAPLTMLGDHKQLPPVCEMPEAELGLAENRALEVWRRSALYAEDYLARGEESFKTPLHTLPPLSRTKLAPLRQSHRYGENLTRLLDRYLYQVGLRGLEESTELLYIDSGARSEGKEYRSLEEARAMKGLIRELLESGADFGVITPFVSQRRQILEEIPELRGRERVMTIHGSQGQEFESVIFSPVCLHYHLTNSKNPSALQALNVALSRAKKRIIIVCDYRFWIGQRGQFLGEILRESQPWRYNTP